MADEPAGRDEARWLKTLLDVDPQLALLALLTRRGVKPASRWERPLVGEALEALTASGLGFRQVHRRTRDRSEVAETVFSTDASRLEVYAARCEGTAIDKSDETKRFEGRFFGYPECCVEAFIHSTYAPNGLAREDQAILFHWACPECERTPALLEQYREAYEAIGADQGPQATE